MLRLISLSVALLLLTATFLGCEPEAADDAPDVDEPVVETRADSVAMALYDALGGPEAWATVPYLRFNFAVGQNDDQNVVARHLWDRQSGDYRLEWEGGEDSTYVALFDVEAFGEGARGADNPGEAGQTYLNGEAVDEAENAEYMEQAHQRFVNDTYWLLAPVKAFDPGVNRAYVPDSSDAETDVITLTFGEVGITPDDQYWLYVDRETGLLTQWAFHLQGMDEEDPPAFYEWADYESFDVPGGTVRLAASKSGRDNGTTLYTDALDIPESVPDGMFTDPEPRLD